MKTLIIASGEGFKLLQTDSVNEVKQPVVAVYDDKVEAEAGLARAKALEETIRPLWLAALAHANKLESLMLDAVWAAAKPLANPDAAG
jgi:hypothetical protein